MANIELAIKVPEEDYLEFSKLSEKEKVNKLSYYEKMIAYGTPLPKGHGRLIDADELLTSERPKGIADDVWKESHIYKLLSNAQTIIEADKQESEKRNDNN